MGSVSVVHQCHVASPCFEIPMCLKRRQNKGRMKGSLGLMASLKIELSVFLLAPSRFSVPSGFNQLWTASLSSGEKGFADTGTRTSGPLM